MEQMVTFKTFLEENPTFWADVSGHGQYNLGIVDSEGNTIYDQGSVSNDINSYYAYYYVNRDYEEMVHRFRMHTQKFLKDGWVKLFETYNDIDVKNLFFDFLRESKSNGKNWNRNRPLNLVNDEDSATSTNGFANEMLDKGQNRNQVSQFKKLVEDFRNIYKAYIHSFGYLFCEVF